MIPFNCLLLEILFEIDIFQFCFYFSNLIHLFYRLHTVRSDPKTFKEFLFFFFLGQRHFTWYTKSSYCRQKPAEESQGMRLECIMKMFMYRGFVLWATGNLLSYSSEFVSLNTDDATAYSPSTVYRRDARQIQGVCELKYEEEGR